MDLEKVKSGKSEDTDELKYPLKPFKNHAQKIEVNLEDEDHDDKKQEFMSETEK